jgi:dihydropteroate synthase
LNVSDCINDVGFGFGKTIDQNYDLLRNLQTFKIIGLSLSMALSRKTMFWKLLNTSPERSTLCYTGRPNLYALLQGVNNITCTHDVKATKDIIKIIEKIKEN